MARDTDRLLQSLTGVDENSMRYAQMQAQREAQDQATGIGLHEMAARRTDQLGQQAAQMGMHEQARGDSLAAQAADLEMRKAHQAELLAQRVADMQEKRADRESDITRENIRETAATTRHDATLKSNVALKNAEINGRKTLKETVPAPRPGGSGMGYEDRVKLFIVQNAGGILRDAYKAKPGESVLRSEQDMMNAANAENKKAALKAFQAQVKQAIGREATPEEVDGLLADEQPTPPPTVTQPPPAVPAVTGGAPVPKPWAVGKTATSTQR